MLLPRVVLLDAIREVGFVFTCVRGLMLGGAMVKACECVVCFGLFVKGCWFDLRYCAVFDYFVGWVLWGSLGSSFALMICGLLWFMLFGLDVYVLLCDGL